MNMYMYITYTCIYIDKSKYMETNRNEYVYKQCIFMPTYTHVLISSEKLKILVCGLA